VAILTATLFPCAALISVFLLTRGARPGKLRNRANPRWRGSIVSVPTYAVGAVLRRPWRSLAIVIGMAVAAPAIAAAAAVTAVVGLRVGPTLLATAITARLQVFELTLLVLTGGGGFGFVWLALRRDLADRSTELEVMGASGWSPATIGGMLRWQRVLLFVPAAVVAFGVAVAIGEPATDGVAPGIVIGSLAVLLSLSAVIWGAAARPGQRP